MAWIFFQESASEGVGSVVANAALIRKIYFPRQIFPLTAALTKLLELEVSFFILAGLMIYYEMAPAIYWMWAPLIIFYTLLVSLCISLMGAAANIYYRDVRTALPMVLSLLWPGMLIMLLLLPLSYMVFRRAENCFANVV